MRLWWLVLGTWALALLGLAGRLSTWATAPHVGVSLENFHRLKQGMTAQEAEEILGQPNDTAFGMHYSSWETWQNGDKTIILEYFGGGDRATWDVSKGALLENGQLTLRLGESASLAGCLRRLLPW